MSGALTTLAAGPALAQAPGATTELGTLRVEGEGPGGFTIQPPQDQGYRADRILSATRTETALRHVPQAITVVTRQQLNDRAVQSMAEAVRYVPGLSFAQGEGNRDAPVFRGNTSTSDFFVDGVRDDAQFFRDVYNLERLEVLTGPNAMIFGRGGVGGVINRVTRQADWRPTRELRLETGSYRHYRGAFDAGQGVSGGTALRLTGVYESSDSYRDGVSLERWGLNPTAAFRLGGATLVQLGYEHFEDDRVADRGVPSFRGRPLRTAASTFFGDPGRSPTTANVDALSLAVEHQFGGGFILRNRTRYTAYDKFYQNVFPGAVDATGSTVSLSAYNNATERTNLINQTDLTLYAQTGALRHTLLLGAELGRQATDNLRTTGFFTSIAPGASSVVVPVSRPTISLPLSFRVAGADAANSGVAKFAGVYLQDQVELSPRLQAVLGLRYDEFQVDFRDNRTGGRIETTDRLWSPRAGLVFKPVEPLSLYASYTISYLPRAGEQLASLTPTTRAFDPETFKNYEVGAKWDVAPDLLLTAALFRLDRSNVVVPDPRDPTLSILVDGQTTRGLELSATGKVTQRWSVVAAYAYQDGEITRTQSPTVRAGAQLANLPKHSLAIWNRYELTSSLAVGLGVTRQSTRFAASDNLVTLPAFTRVDAAVFYGINEKLAAQLNVENVLDVRYYPNAHNNNNIMPGSPRLFRAALTARF